MTTPKLAITTAVLMPTTDLIYRCLLSHSMLLADDDVVVSEMVGDFNGNKHVVGEKYETLVRANWNSTTELGKKLSPNLGVTGSLQWLYENTTAPIIAFLHSDTEVFEQGWDERVLREFEDPKVGLVGFGGGLGHGDEEIYKTPYNLCQLRRLDYISNSTDADSHGRRFTAACDVAVLDGFALVLRRSILARVGGWPVAHIPFHCYDYWACVVTHQLGYRIRLVGIDCTHHGGATATTPAYQEWSQRVLGKTDAQIHEESHRVIYDMARNVLPWRVK